MHDIVLHLPDNFSERVIRSCTHQGHTGYAGLAILLLFTSVVEG